MHIYLAADHAGFELKEKIKEYVEELGFTVHDYGAHSLDKDDDYPDYMHKVASAVSESPENACAFLFGGSGQGEAMVANRHAQVRAAVFYGTQKPNGAVDVQGTESSDEYAIVTLARGHNNANVLSVAARFVDEESARRAVKLFLETPFSGEGRHERRIGKIDPSPNAN